MSRINQTVLDTVGQFIQKHQDPEFWRDLPPHVFFNACGARSSISQVQSLQLLINSAITETPWGFWGLSALRVLDPEQERFEYSILINHALQENKRSLLFSLFEMASTKYHSLDIVGALEHKEKKHYVFDFLERVKSPDVYRGTRLCYLLGSEINHALDTSKKQNSLPLDWLFTKTATEYLGSQEKKEIGNALWSSIKVLATRSPHPEAQRAIQSLFALDGSFEDVHYLIASTLLTKKPDSNDARPFLFDLIKKQTEEKNDQASLWVAYFLKKEIYDNTQPLLKKTLSFLSDEQIRKAIPYVFDEIIAKGQTDHVLISAEIFCNNLGAEYHSTVLSESMRVLTKDFKNIKNAFEKIYIKSELSQKTPRQQPKKM